jgi:hypothetical protein
MVLISHDFRLLQQCAKEIWIVDKGLVSPTHAAHPLLQHLPPTRITSALEHHSVSYLLVSYSLVPHPLTSTFLLTQVTLVSHLPIPHTHSCHTHSCHYVPPAHLHVPHSTPLTRPGDTVAWRHCLVQEASRRQLQGVRPLSQMRYHTVRWCFLQRFDFDLHFFNEVSSCWYFA